MTIDGKQINPDRVLGGAVSLSPDLFTPLTRTPWAGDSIGRLYKTGLAKVRQGMRIGESWEFSCDPDFPSLVRGTSLSLADLVRQFPERVLSAAQVQRGRGQIEILVKLLDASEPLSLQAHPADGDLALAPGECGKTESWLVLDARPGAGLYLGFRQPVSREELGRILRDGQKARSFLQFVPVVPGDYFEIAPGTVHAIGAGVTLLEPQRIEFGKSGKTWRLWDWGRRYNDRGEVDMVGGKERTLHLAEGLRVIDPAAQSGTAFVDGLRATPRRIAVRTGVMIEEYPANAHYQLARVKMDPGVQVRCAVTDGFAACIMLQGMVEARGRDGGAVVGLGRGQPALLPASGLPMDFSSTSRSDFALVIPAGAAFGWR